MRNSIIYGNINKKARVEVEGEAYRLVQVRSIEPQKDYGKMEIWKRESDGSYSHFGFAGKQVEIDRLTLEHKRELLRSRIIQIINEADIAKSA